MAYKDPKKRQMWLKIWFSTLEEAEEVNQGAFELNEEEEEEFLNGLLFDEPNLAAPHVQDYLILSK